MSDEIAIDVDAGFRGKWHFKVEDERLVFAKADGAEVHTFTRDEMPGRVQMSGLLGLITPALVADIPKSILVRVSRRQAAQLLAWLGPPSDAQLRYEIHKRFKALLPIGIVLLLFSFPFGNRGLDYFGVFQAALLLLAGVAAYRSPGRYVFLLDCAWFAITSIWWVLLVLEGMRSPWVLLFLPLNAYWIVSGVRLYDYFAPRRAA